MSDFKIPVIEYDCTPRKPCLGTSLAPLEINERQLVVATVRSILTAKSTRATRRYLAAIVRPTLDFMLDLSRAPALCVSHDFINTLKDFSSTSRVGELAQGVSYAYWLIGRGYIWIADFEPWARSTGVVISPTCQKPDFVMFDPVGPDIAVMEAKGTKGSRHAPPLRAALKQCNTVLPHVYANRGIGCALTLDAKGKIGECRLHLRDPAQPYKGSIKEMHLLFRQSYASWFEMSGDPERAAILRDKPNAPTRIEIPDQKTVSKRANRNDPLRRSIAHSLELNPDKAWFEVDKEVWRALHDEGYFVNLNLKKLASRLKEESRAQPRLLHFPDGTRILTAPNH